MAGLLWNSVGLFGVVLASFLPLPAGGKMARDCGSRIFAACPRYKLFCEDGQNINITRGYFVPNITTSVNCSRDFSGCASKQAITSCCKEPTGNTNNIPFNKTELTNVTNQCVSQTTCLNVKAPYRRKYILSYLVYHCYNVVRTVKPSTSISTTVSRTVLLHSATESLFPLVTVSQPRSTTSLNELHTTSGETSRSWTSGTSTGATLTPINAGDTGRSSLSKTNRTILIGAVAAGVGAMAFIVIVCCVVKRRKRSRKRQHTNPEVAKGSAGVIGFATNYHHAYADVSDGDNSEYDHIGQKDVAAADHYDTTASAAQALRPPDDDGSYDFCELTEKTQTKLPDNIYSVVKSV